MIFRKKEILVDSMLAGVLFLMVLLMLMLNSCKHEPDILPAQPQTPNGNGGTLQSSTCDPDSVYFESQVLPILVSNCAKSGCHTPEDHKEGIILNNYNNVMATGDVDPGRPNNSKIYEVLLKTDPDDRMPSAPADPLSQDQINTIYTWIAQGAQNNVCENGCDTGNVTFSGTIFPLLQNTCIGCHSGSTPAGQISLENYSSILSVANNGKLLGSIRHDSGFFPMPKGGNQLASCQIDEIRIWIDGGAVNN